MQKDLRVVLANKAFSPMYDGVSWVEIESGANFTVAEEQRPQCWCLEARIQSHAELARRAITMRL